MDFATIEVKRPWYKRKKVWATIIGVGFVLLNEYNVMSPEALEKITNIVMIFIGGQAVSDIGKHS